MAAAGVFAQVVLLPVHGIMAWLYWRLVKLRWPESGIKFDLLIIGLATLTWIMAAVWGFDSRPPGAGRIWPFVLSTLGGYMAFTGVLWIGFLLRLVWKRD